MAMLSSPFRGQSPKLTMGRQAGEAMTLRLSRERSWLRFNLRVLRQAERTDFDLARRVTFLAIYANNLDEFFAARVQPLAARAKAAGGPKEAQEEYAATLAEVRYQAALAEPLYRALVDELAGEGVRLLGLSDLTADEFFYFGAYVAERIAPRTDLIAGDRITDLTSRALYLACGQVELQYLLRVPDVQLDARSAGVRSARLIDVPGRPGAWVRIEELMKLRADLFFAESALAGEPFSMHAIRLTRSADLDLRGRADWDELARALEGRLDGPPARLEVEAGCPWMDQLPAAVGLTGEEVFETSSPLDLRFLTSVADLLPPTRPRSRRRRAELEPDPFARIDSGDVLLYHPRDSYRSVLSFIERAATDPEVDQIRMTLYRIGKENAIAEALIRAASDGRDVAVLLEGRARFDELENLYWNLRFERQGVRVLAYPKRHKVHAKTCLVRRAGRDYAHFGTGNYNPVTGEIYTDLSLFTAHTGLAGDCRGFFESLERDRLPEPRWARVGAGAREEMVRLIQGEARSGGRVILKLNHLTDPETLDALVQAAERGARVDLIIRSSLTLIHPRFNVRSLVGKLLEHGRVAAFRNGGDWLVWAGSADWMPRNFDRRFELIFPILDQAARKVVLGILGQQLRDDRNAWVIQPDGSERALQGGRHDAQSADRRPRARVKPGLSRSTR